MRGRHSYPREPRPHARSFLAVLVTGALLAVLVPGIASAVGGAAFTSINTADGDPGDLCLNGNPEVNCNIYTDKDFVWINGGPDANHLKPDGTYFFAVLEPGGQLDPNDQDPVAADKNLSDDHDTYLNRRFTTVNGEIDTYVADADGLTPDHDFDAGKIRLSPYTDTTNPGGVYILAICSLGDGYPVAPSDCKYDMFKIRTTPPPDEPLDVNAVFNGLKYRDDNKNGQWDLGEIGLSGWKIDLDCDGTVNDRTGVNGLTTDLLGQFTFTIPSDTDATGSTTCTLTEQQQTGWDQTGNTVDQTNITGNASVILDTFVYTVVFPNDEDATVSDLNFGNIPQGTVTLVKYYDANADGDRDDPVDEPGIATWQITQAGDSSATRITGTGGTVQFDLDPGTYTFTEVQSAGWLQTGNTLDQSATTGGAVICLAAACDPDLPAFSYKVVIPNDQPSSASNVAFGNVCLAAGGGHTLGFWSNKNGAKTMNDGGSLVPELELLNDLPLANATGPQSDFSSHAQFRTWILNANATNMAYMLSAQLAAMTLNVEDPPGFVDPDALVWNGTAFVTIQSVMDDAELALADQVTLSGDLNRAAQEALKNTLDAANNNLNFLQPGPTTCPALSFPT